MLTRTQKKYLRRLAHGSKIIIRIGQNGLTDNVLEEIEAALDHHELVKTGIRVGERVERNRLTEEICKYTGAEIVQKIGNTVVLYRANKTRPNIKLPGD